MNGVVNYEFYVPDLGSSFLPRPVPHQVHKLARSFEKVDPLGFYCRPTPTR